MSGSEAADDFQMIFSNFVWWVTTREVARGLSLFGGASSEVRRCNWTTRNLSVYLSIYL